MLHEKSGKRGTRNRGRYQVAQSWLNRLNDRRYSYFTINICNRLVDSLRILFGASSEARSAIVTTIWRPGFRADILSSQKLLAAILLQKKSVMQVLAANILMRISIVTIFCECFLPWQESRPKPGSIHWQQSATAEQKTLLNFCQENCHWGITLVVQQMSQTAIEPHHFYFDDTSQAVKRQWMLCNKIYYVRIPDCKWRTISVDCFV